jgi:hypothetical protein
MSPVEFGVLVVEVRTEVVIMKRKGTTGYEHVEERVTCWNEIECPDYMDAVKLQTQTKATIKRTVNDMAANLKKLADNT